MKAFLWGVVVWAVSKGDNLAKFLQATPKKIKDIRTNQAYNKKDKEAKEKTNKSAGATPQQVKQSVVETQHHKDNWWARMGLSSPEDLLPSWDKMTLPIGKWLRNLIPKKQAKTETRLPHNVQWLKLGKTQTSRAKGRGGAPPKQEKQTTTTGKPTTSNKATQVKEAKEPTPETSPKSEPTSAQISGQQKGKQLEEDYRITLDTRQSSDFNAQQSLVPPLQDEESRSDAEIRQEEHVKQLLQSGYKRTGEIGYRAKIREEEAQRNHYPSQEQDSHER